VDYYIKPIHTKYKGRLYRSRLEARFAAFFDLLGWKYEYESTDLNGWFPDFSLYGSEEILVEVKPFLMLKGFDEEIEKIKKAIAGTKHEKTEILLLGKGIFKDEISNVPVLGWIGEQWEFNNTTHLIFDYAQFNYYMDKWGFFAANNSYRDRISGLYNGNEQVVVPWFEDVQELWNEAANAVQYHKPI
jgi:hypothetical protein